MSATFLSTAYTIPSAESVTSFLSVWLMFHGFHFCRLLMLMLGMSVWCVFAFAVAFMYWMLCVSIYVLMCDLSNVRWPVDSAECWYAHCSEYWNVTSAFWSVCISISAFAFVLIPCFAWNCRRRLEAKTNRDIHKHTYTYRERYTQTWLVHPNLEITPHNNSSQNSSPSQHYSNHTSTYASVNTSKESREVRWRHLKWGMHSKLSVELPGDPSTPMFAW